MVSLPLLALALLALLALWLARLTLLDIATHDVYPPLRLKLQVRLDLLVGIVGIKRLKVVLLGLQSWVRNPAVIHGRNSYGARHGLTRLGDVLGGILPRGLGRKKTTKLGLLGLLVGLISLLLGLLSLRLKLLKLLSVEALNIHILHV